MNEAIAKPRVVNPPKSLAPDRYEQFLAVASAVLLAFVVAAVARGRPYWGHVPLVVWAHLLTIMVALALTPIMLLRPRGDARHRVLGWVWAATMTLTAFLSLFVRLSRHGQFSFIHILSIYTLIQVPVLVLAARRHNLARHRRGVRAMVTGALLIAGFFTFPFGRMLGEWLFG